MIIPTPAAYVLECMRKKPAIQSTQPAIISPHHSSLCGRPDVLLPGCLGKLCHFSLCHFESQLELSNVHDARHKSQRCRITAPLRSQHQVTMSEESPQILEVSRQAKNFWGQSQLFPLKPGLQIHVFCRV